VGLGCQIRQGRCVVLKGMGRGESNRLVGADGRLD
jgi:hypothetical protein